MTLFFLGQLVLACSFGMKPWSYIQRNLSWGNITTPFDIILHVFLASIMVTVVGVWLLSACWFPVDGTMWIFPTTCRHIIFHEDLKAWLLPQMNGLCIQVWIWKPGRWFLFLVPSMEWRQWTYCMAMINDKCIIFSLPTGHQRFVEILRFGTRWRFRVYPLFWDTGEKWRQQTWLD